MLWVLIVTIIVAIVGPVTLARPARGMICCGGGGGGSCPTPYQIDLTASVTTNATNVTVSYAASSSSPLPWGFGNVYWGTTTSYGYTAATSQSFGTLPTGAATVFLNYLKPDTTYYYKITASDTCTDTGGTHSYSGSYTGSFTTSADSMQTIAGTVYDTSGNVVPAADDLYVALYCQGSSGLAGYDLTNSAGQYSFTVYEGSYLGWVCSGNYVVAVDNWPIDWGQEFNVWSAQWNGHWNETIVVQGPQVLNFYLPTNYVSGWVPLTYDFATNNPYAEFTVSTTSSFSTQESYALSVQGAINGVSVGGGDTYQTTATQSFSQGFSGVEGDSFGIQQEYLVTGTMVFNSATRATSEFPDFFEASGSVGSGNPGISDWLSQPACNSAPSTVKCVYQETDNPQAISLTVGGSLQLSTSFNFGVSAPFNIPGLGITGSISDSYTTTFTSSSSASYTVSLVVKSPSTECYGFVYEFQGDSSLTYGMVMHVWGLGSEPASDCA